VYTMDQPSPVICMYVCVGTVSHALGPTDPLVVALGEPTVRLNVSPRYSGTIDTCVNPPTADTHAQCIRAPRLRCRAQPTAAATQRCCCRAARIQRRMYPRIEDLLALCSRLLRIQRAAVSDPLGYARPCSRAAPQ
jgi:hypothetical protein